ncbi:MAG TPA: aminoacyl-tRNA hydrolase [Anaerolineae bacterium]|nr:aminoacyl-tRNA hydrolase [Anaerolineae bacterium]
MNRFKSPETEAPSEAAALIVGLGNPGREHLHNRHNIGFMVADRWAGAHTISFNKIQHHAIIAQGRSGERHGNRRVIVAKPQTYMNESGRAVGALLRFYKIPLEQLLVIFDELDLPFGTIRLRADGGAGGHNGMRSIIQQLGGNHFARLRLGIGRPPGRMDPAAFVLQDFKREETAELDALLDRAVQAIDTFLGAGITTAMNQFNTNPPRDRTVQS